MNESFFDSEKREFIIKEAVKRAFKLVSKKENEKRMHSFKKFISENSKLFDDISNILLRQIDEERYMKVDISTNICEKIIEMINKFENVNSYTKN